MALPAEYRPDEVVGWKGGVPQELQQLLVDAVRHDLLANRCGGSEQREHYRHKTRLILEAYRKYQRWFIKPYTEYYNGTLCAVFSPKMGWPNDRGVRTRMHVPLRRIQGNEFWREQFRFLFNSSTSHGQPDLPDRSIPPWPDRLRPHIGRKRQPYRNVPRNLRRPAFNPA